MPRPEISEHEGIPTTCPSCGCHRPPNGPCVQCGTGVVRAEEKPSRTLRVPRNEKERAHFLRIVLTHVSRGGSVDEAHRALESGTVDIGSELDKLFSGVTK